MEADTDNTFLVSDEEDVKRLDQYLTAKLPDLTRSRIKRLITEGLVTVNGISVKAGHNLRPGDCVAIEVPPPVLVTLTPEAVALDVLYEDDDIIVINKPANMPVHPGAGRDSGTLVNALISRTRNLSSTGGALRPGIVHRLDMDTTGVLVVARNDQSHRDLAAQFKDHTTTRRYIALVWGVVKKDEGVIDLPLGRSLSDRKRISTITHKGRRAATRYKVLKRYPALTLLELRPETGRTHQIRVHLTAINHPIVGDRTYGKAPAGTGIPKAVHDALKGIKRQMLHAETLGLKHPGSGVFMEFKADLPEDMAALVALLDKLYS
jgi:23S rRNA pseudouridine1911/1915/1917 synthase